PLHIPYRLLRVCGPSGIDTRKPIVTICESGARAGVAASVLAAAGIDARPVLHGGIDDWKGHTVEFRRCGGPSQADAASNFAPSRMYRAAPSARQNASAC